MESVRPGEAVARPSTEDRETPLLRLEEVSVVYQARGRFLRTVPVRAVDRVSLTLDRGETVALVGESGCGKTTLGRVCLRTVQVWGGRVLFEDADITRWGSDQLKGFRLRTQAIFQDPSSSLDPYMSVEQLVGEPLVIHGLGSGTERKDRVLRALEEVHLEPPEDFAATFPHMLSGGQRQRVAIARALILEPALVVADEPVSMIDASSRMEVLSVMGEIQRRRGTTFLYITHDLATARHVSHRIAVLYLGRLVEMGSAAQVLASPLHPYTQALLAAVPEPDPDNRRRRRSVLAGDLPSPAHPPSGCSFHPRCLAAMADLCPRVEPQLQEVRPGHWVVCHLY